MLNTGYCGHGLKRGTRVFRTASISLNEQDSNCIILVPIIKGFFLMQTTFYANIMSLQYGWKDCISRNYISMVISSLGLHSTCSFMCYSEIFFVSETSNYHIIKGLKTIKIANATFKQIKGIKNISSREKKRFICH